MGQRDICCVKGCNSRRYSKKDCTMKSYFRIPAKPPSRREAWLKFSRRKTEVKNSWKICSKHFANGKPSPKIGDVDYLPTKNRCRKRKNKSFAKNGLSAATTTPTLDEKQTILDSIMSDVKGKRDPSVDAMDLKEENLFDDNIVHKHESCPPNLQVNAFKSETNGSKDHWPPDGKMSDDSEDETEPSMTVKSEPPEYGELDNTTQQANVIHAGPNSLTEAKDPVEEEEEEDDDDDFSSSSEDETERKRTQGICQVCLKDFKMPCRLKMHMMTHTGQKRTRKSEHKSGICPICGKFFKRQNELNHHIMRIHEEIVDESSICTVCGKVLSNKSSVSRHMNSVHATSKDHACDECGKCFTTEQNLKKHMTVHCKDKMFICSTCAESFKHMTSLVHHEYTVHGDNSSCKMAAECPVCGLKFVVKSRLRVHMEMHSNTNFECKYCKKQFRHQANLRTHIRGMHEGDIRYVCQYCERKFGNSYNLKVHIRTHTGEKPYVCPNCDKGFADVCNFRRHELKCPTMESPVKTRTVKTSDDKEDFMSRYRHPMYKNQNI